MNKACITFDKCEKYIKKTVFDKLEGIKHLWRFGSRKGYNIKMDF
jgi:hypothetical protein